MNESELGEMMNAVVPPLAGPPDRMAAIGHRIRRRQRAIVAGSAAVTGLVLVAGAAVVRQGPEPVGPRVGSTPSPSVTATAPADDVLRTPGCANYPVAHPTEVGGTPASGNANVVDDLVMRIAPYANAHFADVYAAPELTDIGRLRVYRKPSAAFDAWIMSTFANDCVEIADAKASDKEMEAARDRVTQDAEYWSSRGITIESVSSNPITALVVVVVDPKDLAQARREIPPYYPNLHIEVIPVGAPMP